MNKQYHYYVATYNYNGLRDNYDLDNFEAFDTYNAALILYREWARTKLPYDCDKVVIGRIPFELDEDGNAYPVGNPEKLHEQDILE